MERQAKPQKEGGSITEEGGALRVVAECARVSPRVPSRPRSIQKTHAPLWSEACAPNITILGCSEFSGGERRKGGKRKKKEHFISIPSPLTMTMPSQHQHALGIAAKRASGQSAADQEQDCRRNRPKRHQSKTKSLHCTPTVTVRARPPTA